MQITNVLQRLARRLLGVLNEQEELSHAQLLIEEFRAHDFFLNESQKVAKVGSWIWDCKKDKIQWSDYLVEIFAVTHDSVPTSFESYLNFIPPNQREFVSKSISDAFNQKQSFAFEHNLVTNTGDVRTLNCRGKVVIENGEVKAMIGTSQDITEQKEIEALLKRQRTEAESSNKAKTQFLANMSHEIRTPISAILGFAELLADKTVPEQDRNSYLSLIRTNANWLTELVENILDLSKIESGKIESEKITVDLPTFMMRIRDLVTNGGDRRSPNVEFRFKGKVPRKISTDPTKLRQILINVIRNAQKFTRTGRIVVRVSLQRRLASEAKLFFDVFDTGIGMTLEQQSKVFDAFTQADNSTTRQFGGTGLGLTLSKRLSKALGGDVTIKRSQPGRGTIFRIEVPTAAERANLIEINELAQSTYTNGTDTDYLLANKHILLVDDSSDNREIIKRFLEKAGARVTTEENGRAATERIKNEKFDLVLMDIQMPIMDGLQATREIRKTNSSTPIVALTAHALEDEKHTCLKSGFDDYLTKPINRRVLLEHVSHEIEHSLH